MKYLLGIDFGGGASKATLLDTDGNIVLLQSDSVRISDISTSVARNIEKNLYSARF